MDGFMEEMMKQCRCLLDCPGNLSNSTCILQPNAKCYKKLILINGIEELHAGCLPSTDTHIDQCNKEAHTDFEENAVLECCNNVTMCNDYIHLTLPPPSVDHESEGGEINLVIVLAVCFLFLLFFGVLISIYCIRLCRREHERRLQIDIENKQAACPIWYGDNGRYHGDGRSGVGAMMDRWSSVEATSSGSGMPLLVQRTISRQIEIVKEIGWGRYGKVMLGKWREEKVAVKIFSSTSEESWYRETEIYQTVLLRHENILGFIASDICGTNSCTELYLIADYHENGSLYSYLTERTLDISEALKLTHTACCGLAHLHQEISGTQGKPAIAHRDVKSKNILVKRDGQCCIADLGLAVKFSRTEGKVNIGNYEKSRRLGTKRYMAPELLSQTFHPDSFEAYKAQDVYSLSLVMWEIINRTIVSGLLDDYRQPYYDVVSHDPGFEEMRKAVYVENMRPEIYPQWRKHKVVSKFVKVMEECWAPRPESRLSMLRIRKTFNTLTEPDRKVIEYSSGSSVSSDLKPSLSSSSSDKIYPDNEIGNIPA